MNKTRIAIFASGTGSNAINLIGYFDNHPTIEIGFLLSNKSDAPVLNAAKELGVTVVQHGNEEVAKGEFLVRLCQSHTIDWIVLAGYLRLIPGELIQKFENNITKLNLR